MLRRWVLVAAFAGCGRFVEEDGDLWPPPDTGSTFERREPESFDPCAHLAVDTPILLSSSEGGTSDPRVAWNEARGQFMVVWRDGDRIAFRRLDGDGNPLGLERTAHELSDETPAPAVQASGDPAIIAVPGQQESPFYLTVQRGGILGLDRIIGDEDVVQPQCGTTGEQCVPLADALVATADTDLDARIPALASDGERIAVGYRIRNDGMQLVSFDLDSRGPECAHPSSDDPPTCLDSYTHIDGPSAIGWLPPRAAPGLVAEGDATAVLGRSWWMATRLRTRTLQWLELLPQSDASLPLHYQFHGLQIGTTADIEGGPRIATGNRRFAVAIRRGGAGGTEAWQVSDDTTVACVLSAPELTEGTPAITWAHGRRVAVVGLLPGGRGRRDVVVVRGDAPITEEARALAARRDCPLPIEATELTRSQEGVVARDPDVAFSGDGLGITWAQATVSDPAADVWFALARCVP